MKSVAQIQANQHRFLDIVGYLVLMFWGFNLGYMYGDAASGTVVHVAHLADRYTACQWWVRWQGAVGGWWGSGVHSLR